MADDTVSIAITENGLADSVLKLKGGEEVFVKPLNEELSFPDFLNRLSTLFPPCHERMKRADHDNR
jgi:hypothetical protein